jgi:sterol 24-C-methyltransferase
MAIDASLRESVNRYYSRKESKWGYKYLLKGTKHYGYYPLGRRAGLSLAQAQRLMERRLGESLGLPAGAKVLDAGCGEGVVAIHLAKDFEYQVQGIDILDWSIEQANKNLAKSGLQGLKFDAMDYSDTDFPDNHFDGIYTMETLVHSPDYRKTLKEFRRILKPGGVIVHHEYVLDDRLPANDEKDWKLMYTECPMDQAFEAFRVSNIKKIWGNAGFAKVSTDDITTRMIPFMKRLYQIAFAPYYVLKIFQKEKNHVNTFAGVRSYQLRHQFHYTVIKAHKPE